MRDVVRSFLSFTMSKWISGLWKDGDKENADRVAAHAVGMYLDPCPPSAGTIVEHASGAGGAAVHIKHTTFTMIELALQVTRSDLVVLPQSHALAIRGGLLAFCGALKHDILSCADEEQDDDDRLLWERLFGTLVNFANVGTVSGLGSQSLGWFWDTENPLGMDPYAIEVICLVADQAGRTFNPISTYSPDEKEALADNQNMSHAENDWYTSRGEPLLRKASFFRQLVLQDVEKTPLSNPLSKAMKAGFTSAEYQAARARLDEPGGGEAQRKNKEEAAELPPEEEEP